MDRNPEVGRSCLAVVRPEAVRRSHQAVRQVEDQNHRAARPEEDQTHQEEVRHREGPSRRREELRREVVRHREDPSRREELRQAGRSHQGDRNLRRQIRRDLAGTFADSPAFSRYHAPRPVSKPFRPL